jgi:hypothetical protein
LCEKRHIFYRCFWLSSFFFNNSEAKPRDFFLIVIIFSIFLRASTIHIPGRISGYSSQASQIAHVTSQVVTHHKNKYLIVDITLSRNVMEVGRMFDGEAKLVIVLSQRSTLYKVRVASSAISQASLLAPQNSPPNPPR